MIRTPHRTQRVPPAASALAVLAVAAALVSCAGAELRDRWDEDPHGSFATATLAQGAAAGPGGVATVRPRPRPASDDRVGAAPASPAPGGERLEGPPTPTEGPVRPEELGVAGVDLSLPPDAIAAIQSPTWDPGRRLPYSEARTAFLFRNPDVAGAVERYRASFTRYDQVDWLNDLVRQYDAFGGALKTGATTPQLRDDLRQRFPLHGVVALQGRIVDVDVAGARVTLVRELREALVSFEEAWHGALYWQRAAAILETNHANAVRVVESADALYRTGRTPYMSLIQAQMRAADLGERLTTARRRLDAERALLAALLDVSGDRLGGARLRLDVGLPSLPARTATRAAALAHGPTVAQARLDVARMTLMVQLVERQLLPNLSSGLSYEPGTAVGKPRGDIRYATGGPFLQELRHRQDAADDALAQATRLVPARAEQRWVALDDALRRRVLNAGAQLERARQAFEVAERGYGAGTLSFLDLDQALRWHLDVALAAAAALRDAFVEDARLAVVVGSPGLDLPPEISTAGAPSGATPESPADEGEGQERQE